jgi:hypothetical protein
MNSSSRYEYRAFPDQGYVHILVRGKMTAPDAVEMRRHLVAEHPTLNRLWDFRLADLTAWTADDMRMFNEMIMLNEGRGAPIRVAALVARDVDFGVARMYESISAEQLDTQGGVFRDEEKALAFVRVTKPVG